MWSTMQDLTVGDVDRIDGITGALVVLVEQQRTALAAGLHQLAHLRYAGQAEVLHTCICTPHAHTHTHTHTHTHMYTTHKCACMHIYTCRYTHTHTQHTGC